MTNNFNAKKSEYQKPQLTPEEYREKKLAERNAVFAMADEAIQTIIQDPNEFRQFLDTQSNLNRYSTTNALLVYSQQPEATYLKDYDDWAKDHVAVTKGAKAISILEPVEYTREDGKIGISYNVKKVFDVSQTHGKQTPAPTVNRDPRKLIATMIDTAPVSVEIADELPHPKMGAYYDNDKQTIFVKKDFNDSVGLCQAMATELAHAQLSINSESYSRRDNGFQAVCAGYMFCKKHGVDTKNLAIDRIPNAWKEQDTKVVRGELNKIRQAMNEIHGRVTEEQQKQRQQRSKSKDSR